MSWLRGAILLTVLLLGGVARPQTGETAALGDTAQPQQDSWVTRHLERYFGGNTLQPDNPDGVSLNIAEAYRQFEGRLIEVVMVHQVPRFEDGWNQDASATLRLVTGVAEPFQSYTRDSVIRQYLLFGRGDRVDPNLLADSEVMLRRLPYINDVRLLILPFQNDAETVAVVVEVTDRWPFGVKGDVVTAEEYSGEIYSENLAGIGLRLSNEVLHKAGADPEWGYRGILRKENIKGTFLAAEVEFEDSHRSRSRKIQVDRLLSHPGLHAVGGFSLEHTTDFQREGYPWDFNAYDAWLGNVVRLYDPRPVRVKRRPILVPAVRFYQQDFLDRPVVLADSNRNYQDRSGVLASLTFQSLQNYKTSFMFGEGENEDLPVGKVVKFSAGYEDREFARRAPVFLEANFLSVRHRGDLVNLSLGLGGYLRNRRLEDGLLDLVTSYVTPLFGEGGTRYRFYGQLDYTLGLRRHPGDRLYLGGDQGVRELERTVVTGNQRLRGALESRIFTRLALWGFRFSFFGFAEGGMIGSEKAASIFKEKIYVSTGLGVRLRNPGLVLPTVEMQLSFLTNVDAPGMAVGVRVGNAPDRRTRIPGIKPGVPAYD